MDLSMTEVFQPECDWNPMWTLDTCCESVFYVLCLFGSCSVRVVFLPSGFYLQPRQVFLVASARRMAFLPSLCHMYGAKRAEKPHCAMDILLTWDSLEGILPLDKMRISDFVQRQCSFKGADFSVELCLSSITQTVLAQEVFCLRCGQCFEDTEATYCVSSWSCGHCPPLRWAVFF